MEILYTPDAAGKWRRKAVIWRNAIIVLAVLALTVCIVLCTQVRTENASRLLIAVMALSTLAGWTIILLLNFAYLPAKRQADHMCSMLEEENESYEGRLSLSPMRFAIPHSIVIRKATLTNGEEAAALSINAALADRMPPNGAYVRVQAARKYITAFEVCDEQDETVL